MLVGEIPPVCLRKNYPQVIGNRLLRIGQRLVSETREPASSLAVTRVRKPVAMLGIVRAVLRVLNARRPRAQ